jgi:hypothetical protein
MNVEVITRPRLVGEVTTLVDGVAIDIRGVGFRVQNDVYPPEVLAALLRSLDGRRELDEVARAHRIDVDHVRALVATLDSQFLVDDAAPATGISGMQAILEIEDLLKERIHATFFDNPFWKRVLDPAAEIPHDVMYGMAIENYHFLLRETGFDSPVLGYPTSAKIRRLMNEFYIEEHQHDELVLKGLRALGIERAHLAEAMPLPGTLALVNALLYWSTSDPLFFFATLGVLEGSDSRIDSYLQRCQQMGLPSDFVAPILAHAKINMNSKHGKLSRLVFAEIPAVDATTMARLRRQAHLFVEVYDRFYQEVWEYYSSGAPLLRRISSIELEA